MENINLSPRELEKKQLELEKKQYIVLCDLCSFKKGEFLIKKGTVKSGSDLGENIVYLLSTKAIEEHKTTLKIA